MAITEFVPFLCGLIIGLPSALLCCLELGIIFSNFSNFRSSFFMLVIVRSIASLFNYMFAFLAHRFGKIGLFMSIYLAFPRPILAFLFFVGYYAFHVENLITAFMLLNRLTSILRPMDYEKFWRVCLPISLAITFVLPLLFTVPIFGLDMYIHVQADNETFTLDDHKTSDEINSAEIAAISSVLFAIICLALNLASLIAFKLKKKQNANLQFDAKMERKMTVYTVLTFLSHLVTAIFMILINMTALNFVDDRGARYSLFQKWFSATLDQNEALFHAVFSQNPWVNDLCTVVIPAWLLLWASSKMREVVATKCGHVFGGTRLATLSTLSNISNNGQSPTAGTSNNVVVPRDHYRRTLAWTNNRF